MAGITYCPRCGESMEIGFMLDANAGKNSAEPARWAEGEPVVSFWFGVRNPIKRKVQTYRCTACGYLESYANEPAD
ncbi:MAG: hypothetical protein GY778_23335 [bacterium]|nr:hypothetical protein [bacterium]